jgi:hypothetical protein
MLRYTLRLHGPFLHGTRISAGLLRDLIDVLTEGARGALRLRVEGRSVARGTPPQWLAAAADFELVAIEAGSTVLVFEAPSLSEVAGAVLEQGDLFQPLDEAVGCLGLVQESLEEATEGHEDSDLFDDALLDRFEGLSRVFARGVERVELVNGRPGGRRVTVEPTRLERLRQLRRATPPEQRVRVSGWLDQIRHSDRMFTLKLESGPILRGVAEGIEPDQLARLFGKKAIVSGTAVFRPSGRVLRLEADRIEAAGADFSSWSSVPRPLWGGAAPSLRHPQGPRTGVNAIIGQWPGTETDEEIAQALEELS